jgi:AMMECR1 domain-containing protein
MTNSLKAKLMVGNKEGKYLPQTLVNNSEETFRILAYIHTKARLDHFANNMI